MFFRKGLSSLLKTETKTMENSDNTTGLMSGGMERVLETDYSLNTIDVLFGFRRISGAKSNLRRSDEKNRFYG